MKKVNTLLKVKNLVNILTCLLLINNSLLAQFSEFNTQSNWSLNKKEISFGVGTTHFLGDVSGVNQIGTNTSLTDVDWKSTGYSGFLSYRLRFKPKLATSTTLSIASLKGDDANSHEIIRKSRNLHFKTIFIHLSQRAEFIVFSKETIGNITQSNYQKSRNEQLYIFGGLGLAYFNPKANVNGDWVALNPLKTEGQGLEGGAKSYTRITATVPLGIGYKIGINKMWRIGIEASFVQTFSDYIDDVSGNYYDVNELGSKIGTQSAYLSNPSVDNTSYFSKGELRGNNKKNDAFFNFNVLVSKNITYKDVLGKQHLKSKQKF